MQDDDFEIVRDSIVHNLIMSVVDLSKQASTFDSESRWALVLTAADVTSLIVTYWKCAW